MTSIVHTTPVLYFKNKPGKTHKSRGASKFDGTMIISYESTGGGGWKVTTKLLDEDEGNVGKTLDVTSSVPSPASEGVACGFQWESAGKTVITGDGNGGNGGTAAAAPQSKPLMKTQKVVVRKGLHPKGLQSKGGLAQKRPLPAQPVRNPPPQPVRNPPPQPICNPPPQPSTTLKRPLPSTASYPPIVRRPPPQPRKVLKPLTSRKNILATKKAPAQPIKGGYSVSAVEKEEKLGCLRSVEGDDSSEIIPLSSKLLSSLQPHQEEGERVEF
ncbi:hypothetical protein TL16_g04208 [Triparma laevis f. inornata]|uniref:Uncharacterized protein n=1 Tax=Triparma laevis f. inornata TaxID=1714386 RepID=A0A9W7ACX6_9STRA|nr:hypothetical protein TL16_g04208 [Triparma laevis f. inornata]